MKNFRSILGLAMILAMILSADAQSFLTNGLVAYYPFKGNMNDASGNGNQATNSGAVFTTNNLSLTNSALLFNGNGNYASATISNQPLGNAARTLSCWVKPADPRTTAGILLQGQNNCNGHLFGVGQISGTLYFWGGCQDWYAPMPIPVGQWSFIAISYDGTNRMTGFVNGVAQTLTIGPLATQSARFWMGAQTGNNGQSFDTYYSGSLCNVRMYNYGLNTNQLSQLYAYESNPIVISQDLTNSNVIVGQNLTLGVGVTSVNPVTYQWYFAPANNGGQAGAYSQIISGFVYGSIVTNGGYGYGNIPSISFIGGGGSGAAGYASVSNAVVTGINVTNAGGGYVAPPSVVIGAPNGFLPGQTNSTLTISNANVNSLGNYYVVVSSASSSVTSTIVNLTLIYPPTIVTNPVGFVQSYHTSNTLSVVAVGTAPLSYQWFLNGTNILGANSSSFTITSLNQTNTGTYTVTVTNVAGYAVSSPANVNMLPSLTSPFTGAIGLWGQSIGLNVGAVGSGVLNYQWYFNGQFVFGANSNSYLLTSAQFTNAGLYNVVVSSIYGSVTNAAYQVVVNPANTSIGTCPIIYITGTAGYSYTIQSSINLADTNAWVTITNLTLSGSSEIWADTATDITKPANPKRFYRVLAGQ